MNDIRYAIRQLLASPVYSLVALLTLALGIGVNGALFSIVNSILFRPPGYADPATLVDVYETSPGFRYSTTSYPNYQDVRDQNAVFSGVALFQLQTLGFSRGDLTKSVGTEVVSGNYFEVLRVPIAIGRGFDPAEHDVTGAPAVVVLSHGFWTREFGADPRVVGTTIRLNGMPFQILGIAPPEFRGMVRGLIAEVFVPAAATAYLFPGSTFLTARGNHNSFMRARLKPGVTAEQAASNLTGLAESLGTMYPETNGGRTLLVVPTSKVTLNPAIDGTVVGVSLGLLVVPGLVLIIACANLATLFLTRAAGRRREIAVRMALGASRGQIIRQLLAESMVLSVAGGLVGLLVCAWLASILIRFQPPVGVPLSLDVVIDWRVLLFTGVIAIGTGVVFGLVPALRASRPDLQVDLREGSRGSAARSRLRSGLVAGQLAVSAVLLVGSVLMLRGLRGAAAVDLGFAPAGVATLMFNPQQQGFANERSQAFIKRFVERLRGIPGVSAVSTTTRPPLNLNVNSNEIVAEGAEPPNGRYPEVQRAHVGSQYFKTLGATLVAGRDFSEQDRGGQPNVVVVNEAAAALLWPGKEALGRRLSTRGSTTWREVVGVVKNIKVVTVGEEPTPQIFYPLYQSFDSPTVVIARGNGSPATLAVTMRSTLKELDAAMPVMSTGVLTDQVGTALFPVRLAAMLLTVLGLAGLAIAAVGLYGIIAQGVVARTRELGIRIALGAEPNAVRGMVLREGLQLAVIGLAVGLAIAALASRVLSTWLYGVSPYDPVAFLAGPLVLLAVAAAACLIPARRATRVDPVTALRAD